MPVIEIITPDHGELAQRNSPGKRRSAQRAGTARNRNGAVLTACAAEACRSDLTRWLGVDCAHCHVMGEFDKDDKPAKQTARKLFTMVCGIGQDYFPDRTP